MGLLRFLFALIVLISHAGLLFGGNIASSTIAVNSFYIISGFYMSLILDKKYNKKHSKFLFWSNRFLRIFPLYWATLLVMLGFILVKFFFHVGNEDNAITHYINHAPQISPVFFDLNLINYIVRNLTLIITYDYFLPNDSTPGYLLVQQAATLQVELLFYLIAPWLVSLSKKIFSYFFIIYACITFGIIIPLHLLSYNLIYIFLSVLIYFLLGVGSYNILYKKIADKKVSTRKSLGIFATILLYLLFFNIIPLPIGNFIYYTLFFLTIPFIFKLTKSHVIDLFLGKLSYPIYI